MVDVASLCDVVGGGCVQRGGGGGSGQGGEGGCAVKGCVFVGAHTKERGAGGGIALDEGSEYTHFNECCALWNRLGREGK